MADPQEQPLELILARNLISIITLPAILVDASATFVFYNDAAGEIIGTRFEEMGQIPEDRWRSELGPFDAQGQPLPAERTPLSVALRDARPGIGNVHVQTDAGLVAVEVAALPLVGAAGLHGALLVFWPLGEAWPT